MGKTKKYKKIYINPLLTFEVTFASTDFHLYTNVFAQKISLYQTSKFQQLNNAKKFARKNAAMLNNDNWKEKKGQ